MALDLQAIIWSVQRVFIRGGGLAWATLVVALVLGVQVVLVAMRLSELAAIDVAAMDVVLPTERPTRTAADSPILPGLAERFRITDAALAHLLPDGAAPTALKFEYQTRPDAGLTRQTITYTTQARWDALAPLLDTLQAVDRSVYIGRLQLRREQPEASALEAEIQLSTVYLDTVSDTADSRAGSTSGSAVGNTASAASDEAAAEAGGP